MIFAQTAQVLVKSRPIIKVVSVKAHQILRFDSFLEKIPFLHVFLLTL